MKENSESVQDMVCGQSKERERRKEKKKRKRRKKGRVDDNKSYKNVQLQQQARQLAQDFREEKQKFEDAHRTEKLAYEDKIMRMKNNEELMRSKMQDHIESNYQDLIRKHQTEVWIFEPAFSLVVFCLPRG